RTPAPRRRRRSGCRCRAAGAPRAAQASRRAPPAAAALPTQRPGRRTRQGSAPRSARPRGTELALAHASRPARGPLARTSGIRVVNNNGLANDRTAIIMWPVGRFPVRCLAATAFLCTGAGRMEFRILGNLEAEAGGTRLALGGWSERKVLAVLLLNVG